MAPDGFQDAVRHVGHVTVVAVTASRIRRMMGVPCQPFHVVEAVVALHAGTVPSHAELELIVGPVLPAPGVAGRLVHLMARQARHVAPLVTRRVEHAVEITAAGTDHAVGPERPWPDRVAPIGGPGRPPERGPAPPAR